MRDNPFGDDFPPARRQVNPFGDEPETVPGGDPTARIRQASTRIRRLRAQLGAEGLTPAATRELIDELAAALDAIARALGRPGGS